ncbi:class I SAM-dependent methyltransferase [Algihabitans albus]|uniref:class I SAM-dependent methyltransferase n=1 Tax=Algihabitans albus TaxID=2164067 RepID=UPI0013C37B5E|nr:class I SAM-dependent methyltransferase [Algihabitans albus]
MSGRQWAKACGHLEAALRQRPDDPGLLRALAQSRFAAGQAEPALRALEAACAARPTDSPLQYDRAQLLRRLGRAEAALAAAQAAWKAAPKADEPALLLAELLVEAKRAAEAVDLLTPLSAVKPRDPELSLAFGAALLAAGLPDEALIPLEVAASLPGPKGAFALHNRATCLADLGRIDASAAAAEAALARLPELAGPLWHLGLCAVDRGDRTEAAARFAAAERANPQMGLAAAYHAALLQLTGQSAATEAWRRAERLDPAQTALREAVSHYLETEKREDAAPAIFGFKPSLLRFALAQAPQHGLQCEFGVFTGRSLRLLAETRPAASFGDWHGFDSFEGLPEAWLPDEGAGAYSTRGRLPEMPAGVHLHIGWFAETLQSFMETTSEPLAFANIDCDIYSSTVDVLDALSQRLTVGTVLVFDEYFAYPGWRAHEYKAFQELVERRGLRYHTVALSPFTRQAAIRIEALEQRLEWIGSN